MATDRVDAVVRYGGHAEQIADVRLPRDRVPTALILLVHGGFWRQAYDRHHTDPIAVDLVQRGYAVASIEYRRTGGAGGWPYTFDDLAVAADQLPSLVAALRPAAPPAGRQAPRPTPGPAPSANDAPRPDRGLPVVVLGHSAGGQLALWCAGRHQLPGSSAWHLPERPELAGVVALAPVADIAYADELGLDDGAVAELVGGPGPDWASRLAQVDPRLLPPEAPVVILHGDQDQHVPLELSRRYAAAVRSHGAEVVLEVLAGTEHFALIDPASAAWEQVVAAIATVTPG